jgi:hypothetical protein
VASTEHSMAPAGAVSTFPMSEHLGSYFSLLLIRTAH